MPGRGTTLRNVRVGDDLWTPALQIARERDESLSDVIREALAEYVSKHSEQRA